MNLRFVSSLILVTRKLIIKVLLNDFTDKEWRLCIFNKIRFNVFFVARKVVPIITNFKRPIYQTFD